MSASAGRRPRGTERVRPWLEERVDGLVPRKLHPYREQVLYLAVGGWNTLFGYLCFAGLYYWLQGVLPVAVILVFSYAVSIVNAYVCYRYLVFRSRGSVLREIPRFTSVYLVALAANLVVLPLALRTLPLNAYVVQALFTVAVVVLSYLGHRFFSFRHRQGNAGRRETTPQDPAAGGR